MRILLIRHGETASNAQRIVQTPETPLSERGLEQAERLARRLSGERIAHILASDLARAAMTAERVSAATGVPIESEPLLQERNFGDLRGRPYSDPSIRDRLFSSGFEPPAGESWEIFHARVDRAWERIAALASETGGRGDLAVVTHGLVLHSIAARLVTLPDGVVPLGRDVPTGFGNTSLTRILGPAPWRVDLLGCIAHLEADAHADRAAPV